MQQPRKQSKNKQVDTIRRFISGDDVISELLQTAIVINWFETHNLFDAEDRIMINGRPCTMEQYEQELAKSTFKWIEERTYRKGETVSDSVNALEAIPEPIPERSDNTEVSEKAENKPVINPKQYLIDTLKAFSQQEQIDLALRSKAILWQKMQEGLQ